ncbi:MAG: response regulator transcription factor [Prochlorococcus sp.]
MIFSTAHQLTTRELSVLQLICLGLTNREIGKKLHIAESTARDHVLRISHKLQVRNRTACAAEAIRQRLAS